jgi:hypothetical protein
MARAPFQPPNTIATRQLCLKVPDHADVHPWTGEAGVQLRGFLALSK